MTRNKGWKNEPYRHSLSARGIKSKQPKTKNPNMARVGSANGRWKGGKSKTYYRRIAGCTANDGTIVHHKDHNQYNSNPANLEVIQTEDDISARGIHCREHPEKGYRDRPRAFVRWTNKLRNEQGRNWRDWRYSVPNSKRRLTYGEMQRTLLRDKPMIVQAYHNGDYYDEIKFRVNENA